jgi:hypothetical protein
LQTGHCIFETCLRRFLTHGFVSYDAFTGGVTPPAAASIGSSFNDAENSTLTPYGLSKFDGYQREMQSVDVSNNKKVAFDWTKAWRPENGSSKHKKKNFTGLNSKPAWRGARLQSSRTGVQHRSAQKNKTQECTGAHYVLCRSQE